MLDFKTKFGELLTTDYLHFLLSIRKTRRIGTNILKEWKKEAYQENKYYPVQERTEGSKDLRKI